MLRRRMATVAAAFGTAASFVLLLGSRSYALTPDEYVRLSHGEVVTRPRLSDVGTARFVGGVSYVVVHSNPEALQKLLRNPKRYGSLIPRLKHVALVGENEGDRYLRVVHSLFGATYTVRIHEEPREFQFWVDLQKYHDVDDAWGYLHYQPASEVDGLGAREEQALPHNSGELHARGCNEQLLVTYAIMIRLGPGIVRELFSERLRAAALSLPRRLQKLTDQVCQSGAR